MKKVLIFALVACAMLAGCKKENKTTDPENPSEPVVTSDSVDFQLRIYATKDQVKYTDYCAYIKLNGESEERKLELKTTTSLDSTLDAVAITMCKDKFSVKDSVNVYSFNYRAKKGEQQLRFEGKRNNVEGAPAYITAIAPGYNVVSRNKSIQERFGYDLVSTEADSINSYYNKVLSKSNNFKLE